MMSTKSHIMVKSSVLSVDNFLSPMKSNNILKKVGTSSVLSEEVFLIASDSYIMVKERVHIQRFYMDVFWYQLKIIFWS